MTTAQELVDEVKSWAAENKAALADAVALDDPDPIKQMDNVGRIKALGTRQQILDMLQEHYSLMSLEQLKCDFMARRAEAEAKASDFRGDGLNRQRRTGSSRDRDRS